MSIETVHSENFEKCWKSSMDSAFSEFPEPEEIYSLHIINSSQITIPHLILETIFFLRNQSPSSWSLLEKPIIALPINNMYIYIYIYTQKFEATLIFFSEIFFLSFFLAGCLRIFKSLFLSPLSLSLFLSLSLSLYIYIYIYL